MSSATTHQLAAVMLLAIEETLAELREDSRRGKPGALRGKTITRITWTARAAAIGRRGRSRQFGRSPVVPRIRP